ncbi:MAG: TlpA family protein disulfide reductase [Solirubrobacteraceae bacterium]
MSGPLSFDDEAEAPPNAQRPTPNVPPPAKPPGISRYGWWFGVLVFLILAYIGYNTLRNAGHGTTGITPGKRLPPFAVPLALSDLNGDANVATHSGEGSNGERPACSVRGPRVLNSCQLATGAPSAIVFLVTRGGDCTKQLDVIERVRARYPQVRFAAVAIRGSRSDLRADIRSHGWRFPVGYDRDGAVANVYGVAVCPTITFAYPGGTALRTTLGLLNEAKLRATLRELVKGSERRGWSPPR